MECDPVDVTLNSFPRIIDSPSKLKSEKVKTLPDSYFAGPWGTSLIDIGLDVVKNFLSEPAEEMHEYMEATKLPQIKCKICGFTAESLIVMNYHYETPHFKRSEYRCNFCSKKSVNGQEIMEHMQIVHEVNAHMEKPSKQYQCHNCTFEGTQKGQLRRHLDQCEKKFKLEKNLTPASKFVLPAYISNRGGKKENVEPKITKSEDINRKSERLSVKVDSTSATLHVVKRNRIESLPKNLEEEVFNLNGHNQSSDMMDVDTESESLQVECEICDCFVMNMNSLHKHITVAHTVKVSKERIMKKEPNHPCKKCERSFYTEIGLERHYLGLHSLVTKRLEKAFQSNEDSGYCPLCKNYFDFGLVEHIVEYHKRALEVVNISYRCEYCNKTFTLLKNYNNHARSTHGSITPCN